MFLHRQLRRAAMVAAVVFVSLNIVPLHAQDDFVSTVLSTNPIAYYGLDAVSGKSLAGVSSWKSSGGVTSAAPGAPIGIPDNHFARFDGRDGKIVTTQMGGVGAAASIMAWVDLAELPSKAGRYFYVAGESEVGNDLDLQFEPDNALRFYTAGGGHLTYAPPSAVLVNHWHLIVATLDTASQTRVIYWDGKPAASDKGGGEAGKKNAFAIGESPVFTGRFFHGGIEEVALWNRALKAAEVAAIFASANPSDTASAVASSAGAPAPSTGPFATTAKVEVEDSEGPIKLKREEQIAYMFLSAIESIERDCQFSAKRFCTFDQVLNGADHLKFDPNKTDPNYTYTLAVSDTAYEAHANAKKPGLIGFCLMARNVGIGVATYSPTGKAGFTDKELAGRSIVGDSFDTR